MSSNGEQGAMLSMEDTVLPACNTVYAHRLMVTVYSAPRRVVRRTRLTSPRALALIGCSHWRACSQAAMYVAVLSWAHQLVLSGQHHLVSMSVNAIYYPSRKQCFKYLCSNPTKLAKRPQIRRQDMIKQDGQSRKTYHHFPLDCLRFPHQADDVFS